MNTFWSRLMTALKDEEIDKLYVDLLERLVDHADNIPNDAKRILLDAIVEGLELAAEDDGLGTEGWEHFFGYD